MMRAAVRRATRVRGHATEPRLFDRSDTTQSRNVLQLRNARQFHRLRPHGPFTAGRFLLKKHLLVAVGDRRGSAKRVSCLSGHSWLATSSTTKPSVSWALPSRWRLRRSGMTALTHFVRRSRGRSSHLRKSASATQSGCVTRPLRPAVSAPLLLALHRRRRRVRQGSMRPEELDSGRGRIASRAALKTKAPPGA